ARLRKTVDAVRHSRGPVATRRFAVYAARVCARPHVDVVERVADRFAVLVDVDRHGWLGLQLRAVRERDRLADELPGTVAAHAIDGVDLRRRQPRAPLASEPRRVGA